MATILHASSRLPATSQAISSACSGVVLSRVVRRHYWKFRCSKARAHNSVYRPDSHLAGYWRYRRHVPPSKSEGCGYKSSSSTGERDKPGGNAEINGGKHNGVPKDGDKNFHERAFLREFLNGGQARAKSGELKSLSPEEAKAEMWKMWKEFVEKEPYRALFGRREELVWNPWKMFSGSSSQPSHTSMTRDKEAARFPEEGLWVDEKTVHQQRTSTSGDVKSQATSNTTMSQKTEKDYSIDPITLRRRPVREQPVSTSTEPIFTLPPKDLESSGKNGEVIKVNKFEPKLSDLGKEEVAALISNHQTKVSADAEKLKNTDRRTQGTAAFVSKPETENVKLAGFATQPGLIQDWVETTDPKSARNKMEDLDLLRASDVRARSGILKPQRREVDTKKIEARRIRLIEAYDKEHKNWNTMMESMIYKRNYRRKFQKLQLLSTAKDDFVQQYGSLKTPSNKSVDLDSTANTLGRSVFSAIQDNHRILNEIKTRQTQKLQHRAQAALSKYDSKGRAKLYNMADILPPFNIEGEKVYHANNTIRWPQDDELSYIKSQTPALSDEDTPLSKKQEIVQSHELSSSTGEFYSDTDLPVNADSSLGSGEKQALLSTQPLSAVNQDQKPTTIDSSKLGSGHPENNKASAVQEPENPLTLKAGTAQEAQRQQIYQLLAFDEKACEVKSTQTRSSLYKPSSSPRSADSILSYLDNPSEYFPQMAILEKKGYELVAGSRSMLVFKKTNSDGESIELSEKPLSMDDSQPALSKPVRTHPRRHTSIRRVSREEAVFSGTPLHRQRLTIEQWQDYERRIRRSQRHSPKTSVVAETAAAVETSAAEAGASTGASTNTSSDERKQRRGFRKVVFNVLSTGFYVAIGAYAGGVMWEYYHGVGSG